MPTVLESDVDVVPQAGPASSRVASIPTASFAARFCTHRRIKLENYEEVLFRRTLYPLARWLRPALELLPDFFSPDRAFIRSVGRATNMREIESAMVDFADNRGRYRLLRKRLRLRVSASMVWMFANRFLKAEPTAVTEARPNSQSPFAGWGEGTLAGRASSSSAAVRTSRAAEEAEISRLRAEVARLSTQCDVLRRTMGMFGETKLQPPSFT